MLENAVVCRPVTLKHFENQSVYQEKRNNLKK